MPKYSVPKTIYHSYFGLKPNETPTLGPGAHSPHTRSTSSSVLISPSRKNRSMIDESRARIEAAVGPGAYNPVNASSFPPKKH